MQPELLAHIASFMPPNDVACSLRLVNKDAANLLQRYTVVRLSQPVPVWAFTQRWGSPGACRPLTPAQRRELICLTAAAGDIINLWTALSAAGYKPSADLLTAAASGCRHSIYRCLAEQEDARRERESEEEQDGACGGRAWRGTKTAALGAWWLVCALCGWAWTVVKCLCKEDKGPWTGGGGA